jgi:hypothetical protein
VISQGRLRHFEAQPDVALACQMMELLRLDAVCNPPKGATIFQLGVMEKQLLVVDSGIRIEMRQS